MSDDLSLLLDIVNMAMAVAGIFLAILAMKWARDDERAARQLNSATEQLLKSIEEKTASIKDTTLILERNIHTHVVDNNRQLWRWIGHRDRTIVGAVNLTGEQDTAEASEVAGFLSDLLSEIIIEMPEKVKETDLALLEEEGIITPEQYRSLAEILQDRLHERRGGKS